MVSVKKLKKAVYLATLVVSVVFVYYALFTQHNGGKITSNDNQAHRHRSCHMKSLGGWIPIDSSKSGNHSSSDTKKAESSPVIHQETETLTRLGSALSFEVDACPTRSLMLGNWQNQTPQHNNCPTLFLVGARKGGTTSLYHYVDQHPDFEGIRLNNQPMDGETFYFTHHLGRWNKYISQFPENCMSGESTVDNMVHCEVPRKLFRACGLQAKVVMLLRNPIERFVSNFLMRVRLGTYAWLPTSMKTNISSEAMSELQIAVNTLANTTQNYYCATLSPKDWRKYRCRFAPAVNMVYEGMYYIFVMNYLCNIPAENILIVNSEEFFSNPSRILSQIFIFLGLERLNGQQLDSITSAVFNKRQDIILPHQVLSVAVKNQLNYYAYRPFNAALFKLLQWNEDVMRSLGW